jgi:predicted enzyme related to lactoylglutathione lyase
MTFKNAFTKMDRMSTKQDSHQDTQKDSAAVDVQLTRNGGLSYIEIPATDLRQSAAFYQAVLGWQMRGDDPDQPKFSDQTGHLIGRWVSGRAISRKPGLLPFIYVDGIDDVAKRVVTNGGEIVKPPYREGNLWISIFRDPAGNLLGLWQECKV